MRYSKASKLNLSTLLLVCVLILIQLPKSTAKNSSFELISKINTDQKYKIKDIEQQKIYAINVQRISTTQENQKSKCRSNPKKVVQINTQEKFRIGSSLNRSKSVYQSLTTLNDEANGIKTFTVLQDNILVILNNGTVLFVQNDQNKQKEQTIINFDLNMNFTLDQSNKQNKQKILLDVKIAKIKNNAFIATRKQISYCEPSAFNCTKLSGYNSDESLVNFYAFTQPSNDKQYLFKISGNTIRTYQLSANAALVNQQLYTCEDFKLDACYFVEMIKLPGNKFAVLDYNKGLIQIQYQQIRMNKLKKYAAKNIYQQFGCMHIISENQGSYIGLQCTMTRKSFFILQLYKNQFGNYNAQQPIFFNEALTGLSSANDIIMAHIFSGVKLFWSSKEQYSYPYDFHNAGSIFLHNAKNAEIKIKQNKKIIYISTEQQLRVYEIATLYAGVNCYSQVPIEEQYKLIYTYQCPESQRQKNNFENHQCTMQKPLKYISWQHKQINFTKTILPLIVAVILVGGVGFFLYKIHKKYENDVQAARLKYNTENQFGFQTN